MTTDNPPIDYDARKLLTDEQIDDMISTHPEIGYRWRALDQFAYGLVLLSGEDDDHLGLRILDCDGSNMLVDVDVEQAKQLRAELDAFIAERATKDA